MITTDLDFLTVWPPIRLPALFAYAVYIHYHYQASSKFLVPLSPGDREALSATALSKQDFSASFAEKERNDAGLPRWIICAGWLGGRGYAFPADTYVVW